MREDFWIKTEGLEIQASLHMIGAGGLCGAITAIMLILGIGNPIIPAICFLLSGMLGTARLFLKAHTPAQVFIGFLAGFGIEFGLVCLAFN